MKATHQHSATGKQSLLRPCLLMLLVLFCSVPGWGSKQESIKKKEINKSFNVGKSDILQVDNRYGNITVIALEQERSLHPCRNRCESPQRGKGAGHPRPCQHPDGKDGQYGFQPSPA